MKKPDFKTLIKGMLACYTVIEPQELIDLLQEHDRELAQKTTTMFAAMTAVVTHIKSRSEK